MNFTSEEKDVIFSLCQQLTGSAASFRADVVLHSVAQRMAALGVKTLVGYLEKVETYEQEMAFLLSALTIHTTRWFREPNHFLKLENWLMTVMGSAAAPRHLRLLSAGCSTGEEAASIALVCEHVRHQLNHTFSYEVVGIDIDPVSIERARQGVLIAAGDVNQIPPQFHRYLKHGGPKNNKDFWCLMPSVAQNLNFIVASLVEPLPFPPASLHGVLCRNVLIYFDEPTCQRVVYGLQRLLVPQGLMLLGTHEHTALTINLQNPLQAGAPSTPPSQVILLGASTGGPPVLETILGTWAQRPCPPVVVVQHISSDFMGNFRKRLAQSAGLHLAPCQGEEPLQHNTLYTPADAKHLVLQQGVDGVMTCKPWGAPPVGGHLPSVDVTFQSGATLKGVQVWAGLLTGMGTDGAQGLLALKNAGATTWAQNQSTCAVFGMPKQAIALGAALKIGSPQDIRKAIENFALLKGRRRAS